MDTSPNTGQPDPKRIQSLRRKRKILRAFYRHAQHQVTLIEDELQDAGMPLSSEEDLLPTDLQDLITDAVEEIAQAEGDPYEPEEEPTPGPEVQEEEVPATTAQIVPFLGANLQGASQKKRNSKNQLIDWAQLASLGLQFTRDGGSNCNESRFDLELSGMGIRRTIEEKPYLLTGDEKVRETLQRRMAQDDRETVNLIAANSELAGRIGVPSSKTVSMDMTEAEIRAMADHAIAAGVDLQWFQCANEINGHIHVLLELVKAKGIALPQKGTREYFEVIYQPYYDLVERVDAIAQDYRCGIVVAGPPTAAFFPESIDEAQGDKAAAALQNVERTALQNGTFIDGIAALNIQSPVLVDVHRYTQVDLGEKEVITDPDTICERATPGLSADYYDVFNRTLVQFYRNRIPGARLLIGESGIRKSQAMTGNTVAGAIDLVKRTMACLRINQEAGTNLVYAIAHQVLYGEPKYGLIQYDDTGISLTVEGQAFRILVTHLADDFQLRSGDRLTHAVYESPSTGVQIWYSITGDEALKAQSTQHLTADHIGLPPGDTGAVGMGIIVHSTEQ